MITLHAVTFAATTITSVTKNLGQQVSIAGGFLLTGLGGAKLLGHYLGDRHNKIGAGVIMALVVGAFFFAGPLLINLIHGQSQATLK